MTQFKVINIGADLQERSIHWKDFMLHFLYPVMQSHSSLLLDCMLSCFKGEYCYKVHMYFKLDYYQRISLNHINLSLYKHIITGCGIQLYLHILLAKIDDGLSIRLGVIRSTHMKDHFPTSTYYFVCYKVRKKKI